LTTSNNTHHRVMQLLLLINLNVTKLKNVMAIKIISFKESLGKIIKGLAVKTARPFFLNRI